MASMSNGFRFLLLPLWCLVAFPGWIASAAAQESPSAKSDEGILSLTFENDLVTGTDRDYTHGSLLTWLSPEVQGEHWARRLIERVPGLTYGDRLRYSFSLGQNIYTPKDTQTRRQLTNDRPYAGWLYLGVSAVAYDAQYELMQSFEVNLGVVGPPALGRQVQNTVHRLIDSPETKGWKHQLDTEPGLVVSYERKWREFHYRPSEGRFGIDMLPHVGVSLGNIATYVAAGGEVRVGFDLEEDFGAPRIRPSPPGSTFFRSGGLSGYVFLGAEGRLVARDIFLDGNTFGGGHSVSRRPYVGDFQAGVSLNWGDFRVAYSQVFRTPQIRGRKAWDRFGALSASWRMQF
jgi:lipid A 3-O-deacylase